MTLIGDIVEEPPWDNRWWWYPGLIVTGISFLLYGTFLLLSQDPDVPWPFGTLGVLAGLAMFAFTVVPYVPATYRTAGVLGFMLWASQATRLGATMLQDGFDKHDWRIAAVMVAYIYFSVLFWLVWTTTIKAWHNVMWARRKVDKESRGS